NEERERRLLWPFPFPAAALDLLIPKPVAIDLVFADFVIDDALGRAEEACGFCPVAAGGFEGIQDDVLFKSLDSFSERERVDRSRSLRSLKRRRKVMSMHDIAVANQHCALDHIFQL